METVSRDQALADGFAKYDDCQHLEVEVPNEKFTITARTPNGRRVTFCFHPAVDGNGHHCVDIVHHTTNARVEGNHPIQQAAFLGVGTTPARCSHTDDDPTTLISLSLYQQPAQAEPWWVHGPEGGVHIDATDYDDAVAGYMEGCQRPVSPADITAEKMED